jgi:hypothetical protein
VGTGSPLRRRPALVFGVALQLAELPGLHWTAAILARAVLPLASLLAVRHRAP